MAPPPARTQPPYRKVKVMVLLEVKEFVVAESVDAEFVVALSANLN